MLVCTVDDDDDDDNEEDATLLRCNISRDIRVDARVVVLDVVGDIGVD